MFSGSTGSTSGISNGVSTWNPAAMISAISLVRMFQYYVVSAVTGTCDCAYETHGDFSSHPVELLECHSH